MHPVSLAQLPAGASARVASVEAPGALGHRLADLGFLPGTPVACLRRAPLGDPRLYELRGVQLCLRREDAEQIRIRVEDEDPADPDRTR